MRRSVSVRPFGAKKAAKLVKKGLKSTTHNKVVLFSSVFMN
jgi:hypothetical protein